MANIYGPTTMPNSTKPSGSKSATTRAAPDDSGSNASAAFRVCKSSYSHCDPTKPGIRNMVPLSDRRLACSVCRERAAEWRKKDKLKKLALAETQPGMHVCLACPNGTLHKEENMGVNDNGVRSTLCSEHYKYMKDWRSGHAQEQREKQLKRNQTPKRKAQRKQGNEKGKAKTLLDTAINYAKTHAKNDEEHLKRKLEHTEARQRKHPKRTVAQKTALSNTLKSVYPMFVASSGVTGRALGITFEDFEKLTTSSCYYCLEVYREDLLTVDRINGELGYTSDNVVPVCQGCNMMKGTLNESTFVLMCEQISIYSRRGKPGPYGTVFNNYIGFTYSDYKCRAVQQGYAFEIDACAYERMTRVDPCYACGRYPTAVHSNAIDRVNSKKGYTLANSRSCCTDCASMKQHFTWDSFTTKCANIAETHRHQFSALHATWTRSRSIAQNINEPEDTDIHVVTSKRKHRAKQEQIQQQSDEDTCELDEQTQKYNMWAKILGVPPKTPASSSTSKPKTTSSKSKTPKPASGSSKSSKHEA
ncbi:Hypothetical protein MVR_LOCUS75 [uncultured virus]|nr:Hypothetical protein MVR_LOCUS75 [uncultured virus]